MSQPGFLKSTKIKVLKKKWRESLSTIISKQISHNVKLWLDTSHLTAGWMEIWFPSTYGFQSKFGYREERKILFDKGTSHFHPDSSIFIPSPILYLQCRRKVLFSHFQDEWKHRQQTNRYTIEQEKTYS